MKSVKKIVTLSVCILLVCCLLFLVYFNLKNNDSFLEASLSSCVNIAVIFALSFSLTQITNNQRKQKEIIEKIISDLQIIINDRYTYEIPITFKSIEITMRNRQISNKIEDLKRYSSKLKYSKEIQRISSLFREYEEFIGDNINDREYLSKSQTALNRPLNLMDRELNQIKLALYN